VNKLVAVVVGFLVAPLVPAVALALFSPVSGGDAEGIIGGAVLFYVFALLFTGLFGVPAFFVLLRFKLVSWWSSAVGGAAIGAIVAVAISSGAMAGTGLLVYAALGALAAVVFWFIGGRAAAEVDADVPAA